MLPSLLLATTVLSTPVIINEVKATRESGHLRVEVSGDGGIDPEMARTRIDDGSLYLFLGGTRVKADNRAWNLDVGTGQIRAHRHAKETELYVPLVANGCSGPVELQGTATGMIALVGCEGAAPMPRASARRATVPVPTAETKMVETKTVETKAVERAPKPAAAAVETKPAPEPKPAAKELAKATAPSLNALVALPANDEAPVVKAASVLPVPGQAEAHAPSAKKHAETAAAKDVEKVEAAKPEAEKPQAASTESDSKTSGLPGLAAAKDGGFGAGGSASAGLGIGKMAVPVLLLATVAVAAYLFTRRKRAANNRQIEILESASLGPKRSLIVARVGEETLYLGASEAGITLLKSSGPAHAAPVAPADVPRAAVVNELDQSLTDALADVPEPSVPTPVVAPASFRSIEGGLASLFGKGAVTAPARPEARGEARSSARFDEILEDSLEDQELRRKLAARHVGEGSLNLVALAVAAAPKAAGGLGGVADLTGQLAMGAASGSSAVKIFLLVTALSFASALILSLTSFTRIIIVLSFLRQALGTPQLPPNPVLMGLSLFLTMFIMAPVANKVHSQALGPYLDDKISATEALERGEAPLRDWMLKQTREEDVRLFFEISGASRPERGTAIPMTVVIPAFMVSELGTAFRMGLYVFIPMLLVDILVASILMSLGMMMVPPQMISLPLKIGVFLLAGGWHLVVSSLVRSF